MDDLARAMLLGEDAVDAPDTPARRAWRPEDVEAYRRHVNGECPGCSLCAPLTEADEGEAGA